MSVEQLTSVITAGASIATVLVIVWELRGVKEQMRLQVFSEYTRRYNEIIRDFPETINRPDFRLQDLDKETQDKTMRLMRIYFDLCFEEFYLNKCGKIGEEVWRQWKGGMDFAFTKRAFQEAWKRVTEDTKFDQEFVDFVNLAMTRS